LQNIFSVKEYNKNLSFVYINQNLESLHSSSEGNLPVPEILIQEFYDIVLDVRYLKNIHRNMNNHENPNLRIKYLAIWNLHLQKYRKILLKPEENEFKVESLCTEHD
jgi:hypothetical protein